MTNIKNIYCIDINWIEKRISDLNSQLKILENSDRRTRNNDWDEAFIGTQAQIDMLKELKSQLKPIQPLIEDAQAVASTIGMNDKNTVEQHSSALEKYINTKQFEL